MINSHFLTGVSVTAYLLGFMFAIFALWRSRTPQGTAAWVVGLISFPFVAIPAFLVFGRNRFTKYTRKRRQIDKKVNEVDHHLQKTYNLETNFNLKLQSFKSIAQSVRQPAFTHKNKIELLINGAQTYKAMLEQIERAENYILFQFYIFSDDTTGRLFQDRLIKKASQGVKVYFLYDGIGTRLSRKFIKKMTDAGVHAVAFKSGKLLDSKIQINFRNHRKIIIVDGKVCFTGGINIGEDYLKVTWRDTHVMIAGPSVQATQLSFLKDWNWANDELLNLNWQPFEQESSSEVMVLHTGPADESEAALLLHINLINQAKTEVWISNPYFVPPEGLVNALALAAQRGVDVRIIIPAKSDNKIVDLAAKVYVEKLLLYGVKFFKFMKGFPHQKVMLIDSAFGMVGSTNFDSRSFFINFEIQTVSTDALFVSQIQNMLIQDFISCEEVLIKFFDKQSVFKQLLSRAANLVSPML